MKFYLKIKSLIQGNAFKKFHLPFCLGLRVLTLSTKVRLVR